MKHRWLVCLAALAVSGVLATPAGSADWPQFGGPNRDGKSAETGLLREWPAGGPTLLWKTPGCGEGFSSPIIVGDTIYTAGDVGGQGCLLTFSLDGKPKAKQPFAKAAQVDRPGFRSSPTVDKDLVFVLSPDGDLLCAGSKNLQKVWQVNILQRFRGSGGDWRLAESVLVDGERVICTPGGPNATIAALNKRTGATLWTSQGLSDKAAYASCIKYTVGNIPMISTMTEKGLVGVSANTGQFLWRYDRPANGTANCPSPVFADGRVFEATGYGKSGGQVQVTVAGTRVSAPQTWDTTSMDCHHGGYVLVDGYLYGNNGGGWACIDWKTGQTKYKASGVGKGCIIYADGMLYCQNEGVTLGLVEATPNEHKLVSRFDLPRDGKGTLWAHPAISNGRLYVRHGDFLFCYDIKAKTGAAN